MHDYEEQSCQICTYMDHDKCVRYKEKNEYCWNIDIFGGTIMSTVLWLYTSYTNWNDQPLACILRSWKKLGRTNDFKAKNDSLKHRYFFDFCHDFWFCKIFGVTIWCQIFFGRFFQYLVEVGRQFSSNFQDTIRKHNTLLTARRQLQRLQPCYPPHLPHEQSNTVAFQCCSWSAHNTLQWTLLGTSTRWFRTE